ARKRRRKQKSCWIFLEDFCQDLLTGSGTRSTHLPGRGGGWESESLRVFNTRQESGNGDPRAENWVPICASIWDQNPRLRSRSPCDSYPEMGGVCYEPGRPNRGVRCDGPGLVTTRSCWARR